MKVTQEYLNKAAAEHELWLFNQGGTRADFSHQDLTGLDLHGMNLSFANFERANLSNTNLDGTIFVSANLVCVNFNGASTAGTNWRHASMEPFLDIFANNSDHPIPGPIQWG